MRGFINKRILKYSKNSILFYLMARPVLSPIMTRPDTVWSNVWGAVTSSGFYSRSVDYLDIIGRNKT